MTHQNGVYNIDLLEDFEFSFFWITSDHVRQLNQWYEIPIVSMDCFRALIKAYWECEKEYQILDKAGRLHFLFKQLDSAKQNPEKLLRWYLNTQQTPGSLGKNMVAWTQQIKQCSIHKQLDSLSIKVKSLYKKHVSVPYSDYLNAASPLEELWMASPSHRSEWDEYLYKIYFEELSEAPSAIADEEIMLKNFRKFWRAVLSTMPENEVYEFERKLWQWSTRNNDTGYEIDPNINIERSFGMDGYLDQMVKGCS